MHGRNQPLLCRLAIPFEGLSKVALRSTPLLEQVAQVVLGGGVTLIRSQPIVDDSLRLVLRDTQAAFVVNPEIVLRGRGLLLG
ncbi:hypothetical protein D9M72_530350 [compost metagenome]